MRGIGELMDKLRASTAGRSEKSDARLHDIVAKIERRAAA
jgi:hypothetical protein